MRYDFEEHGYISSNYTYLDAEVEGSTQPDIPEHSLSFIAGIKVTPDVDAMVKYYYQGKTPRAQGDSRDRHDDYSLLDTTFKYRGLLPGVELEFAVLNILDKKYTYPSPPPPFSLRNDYPAQGRSFLMGIKYKL